MEYTPLDLNLNREPIELAQRLGVAVWYANTRVRQKWQDQPIDKVTRGSGLVEWNKTIDLKAVRVVTINGYSYVADVDTQYPSEAGETTVRLHSFNDSLPIQPGTLADYRLKKIEQVVLPRKRGGYSVADLDLNVQPFVSASDEAPTILNAQSVLLILESTWPILNPQTFNTFRSKFS